MAGQALSAGDVNAALLMVAGAACWIVGTWLGAKLADWQAEREDRLDDHSSKRLDA